MSMSRGTFGICLLLSALTLAGAGWAQTPNPLHPTMLSFITGRFRSWTRPNSN